MCFAVIFRPFSLTQMLPILHTMWSEGVCIGHTVKMCRNDRIDRDFVSDVDLRGSTILLRIRLGFGSLHGKGHF